jgi:hypothetical protein
VLERCRKLLIEPPADEQIRRLIISALQEHENCLCKNNLQSLGLSVLKRLDALIEVQSSDGDEAEWTVWQSLKADPGKAGLNSVKQTAYRLKLARQVELPADLFKGMPPKLVERYAKRAIVEEPFELRRHAEPLRATLLAAYLHRRSEELTDHLVDLLVETIHKMGKKAESRIETSQDEIIQKAPGKLKKLYRMAKACVYTPKGTVEEVIFPAASEKWLRTFIREVERGSAYTTRAKSAHPYSVPTASIIAACCRNCSTSWNSDVPTPSINLSCRPWRSSGRTLIARAEPTQGGPGPAQGGGFCRLAAPGSRKRR